MKKSETIIKIGVAEMKANENKGEFYLLKTVPAILRARGFRLYTQDNRRLIDLWLNGGAAVLGHTPPNILREIKNTASRGLYAPFPHFLESRYIKALSELLPGRCFRLYAAPPPELVSLFEKGEAKLWRPFNNENNTGACLIPVLPGIQNWRGGLPAGLCVAAADSENQLAQLPPGDFLTPVLLAAAVRGVYDILASPERAKPVLPRTFKIFHTQTRWKRQGIYLSLKEKPDNETWALMFRQFLDAGFLLPPIPSHPVILPGELSAGEDAKLAAVLTAAVLSS